MERCTTIHFFSAKYWQRPDFSVVLFRSDFVLVSEKNHVKMHKNQGVRAVPCSPKCLSGATNRGQTMAPEAQTPSQCPDIVRPHRHVGLQLLENKALSWGIIPGAHTYSLKSRHGKARRNL